MRYRSPSIRLHETDFPADLYPIHETLVHPRVCNSTQNIPFNSRIHTWTILANLYIGLVLKVWIDFLPSRIQKRWLYSPLVSKALGPAFKSFNSLPLSLFIIFKVLNPLTKAPSRSPARYSPRQKHLSRLMSLTHQYIWVWRGHIISGIWHWCNKLHQLSRITTKSTYLWHWGQYLQMIYVKEIAMDKRTSSWLSAFWLQSTACLTLLCRISTIIFGQDKYKDRPQLRRELPLLLIM